MYNDESFEEYMRNILGYPRNNNMCMNNVPESYNIMNMANMTYNDENDEELERCYPEIYRIVYPMVVQRCSRVTEPVTREMVDRMTDEIYSAVEVNNEINLNINLQNEVTNNINAMKNYRKDGTKEKENRSEDRQFGNRWLRDLIRILLIRELLRRHRRPRPGRPPFPGGRPPMMPREYYNDYPELYE